MPSEAAASVAKPMLSSAATAGQNQLPPRPSRDSVNPEKSAPVTSAPASNPDYLQLSSATRSEPTDVKASVPGSSNGEVESVVSDTNGPLEIESLSQGTLEPLAVGASASVSSTVAASRTPADNSEAVVLSAHLTPQSSWRRVIFFGLLALAAIVVTGFILRRNSPKPAIVLVASAARAKPSADVVPLVAASAKNAEASPPAEESAANRAAQPDAPDLANGSASVAPPAGALHEDTVRVAINIRPEGAHVYYRGREVGRTPFTVELLRGERRVFEVGHPGYATRRLVIDGTRKEISYIMTPETKN